MSSLLYDCPCRDYGEDKELLRKSFASKLRRFRFLRLLTRREERIPRYPSEVLRRNVNSIPRRATSTRNLITATIFTFLLLHNLAKVHRPRFVNARCWYRSFSRKNFPKVPQQPINNLLTSQEWEEREKVKINWHHQSNWRISN